MRGLFLKPLMMLISGSFVLAAAVPAEAVELRAVQFPEKHEVDLNFTTTAIAPTAGVSARVEYQKGQARIEIDFSNIKPAILFGGDVTCFVVWAITRDGQAENLGELLTRKPKGRLEFSTGKKNFALVITAESSFLAQQPSELVMFHNGAPNDGAVESALFGFDKLAAAPRHSMDGIGHIIWDSKVPIELLQARKALEMALRNDGPVHAPQVFAEAEAALKVANSLSSGSSKSRDLLDSSRRAVALGNEALNIALSRIEAIEVERQLALRREETAALEQRAAEAEVAAAAAEQLAAEVSAQVEVARVEKVRMDAETASLRLEKAALETTMLTLHQEKRAFEVESIRLQSEKSVLELEAARLKSEKVALEAEAVRLLAGKTAMELEAARLLEETTQLAREAQRLNSEKDAIESKATQVALERDALSNRLHSALSHVAVTEESARGLVVNLPDILFDLNEVELKPETQVILAKLAGILLIMDNQHAMIEGHTDSTGDSAYNFDLSQRRASAVLHFFEVQGLAPQRLESIGYGVERPVSDNTTAEGRRRNRRVEIVISGPQSTETVASN